MSLRPEIYLGGKQIYLAGPMRGIPLFNFPRFKAVTACLREFGHDVFNPAERDDERHGGVSVVNDTGDLEQAKQEHNFSLRDALHDDLAFICSTANAIFMLPGWQKSFGAIAEHAAAVALQTEGMVIVYLTERECEEMELSQETADAA